MVEKANLDNFVQISKSPHLAKHIQNLQIHTLHLLPFDELQRVEPSFILNEPDTQVKQAIYSDALLDPTSYEDLLDRLDEERYRKHYDQQKDLMTSDYAYQCLRDAMSRLKACRKIAFDSEDPPWSTPRLEQSFGILLQRSRAKLKASAGFISELMRTVLDAAGTSGVQIKTLDIHIGYMIDETLCLTLDRLPCLQSHVASLSQLHLVVEPTFRKNKLQQFLDSFPELTDFHLEVYSDMSFKKLTGALDKLRIPNLQKLTLCMMCCTAAELEDLIVSHQKTLQDIDLTSIKLPDDQSWRNVFQKIVQKLHITSFFMEECMDDEELEPSNMEELIRIKNSA
ncbi:uncharacterized protein FTOL_12378 [Fusarium torulosum]|uniref:Uncharacterized protein n=1 Tax=Fusarium torulosum TaxID=33205 RepID=A0AAE8MKG6_9HYPO|nr:uncharacterized protein FTOL_12378 [Fusarium torulosum]